MTNAMTRSEAVRLQSVGLVDAVRADALLVGDVTIWNFGYRYRVAKVERASEKFLSVELVEIKSVLVGNDLQDRDGETFIRRMKTDRLVAYSTKARAALVSEAA